ncbi:MAG: glycosyltransferase family 39 protein [Chloroflexota bacterium]|nr:glycosyltransferase family 39 protein [Chloroflexota bacterium]
MDLMKAQMLREGYRLYSDIWSDQPPFFTLCLAWAFDLFGDSVLVARSVTIAFACLGVVGTAWIGRLLGGRMSSLAGVAFLILSPRFLNLSRSVMIGLPAEALGTLAMACGLMALHTGWEVWLIAAGLGLSASLMTKPIEPFLFVPLGVIVWFLGQKSKETGWRRWGKGLLFLIPALIIPLLVAFCLFEGPLLVDQIVGTYFQRQQTHTFRLTRVISKIVDHVLKGGLLYWTGLFLALYGLVLTWRERNRKGIVVSVWLFSALVTLCSQTRLRSRYLLLLSFPLAGLLSMGLRDLNCRVGLAWTKPRQRWYSTMMEVAVIISLALGTISGIRSALAETCDNHPAEEEAVAILRSTCTSDGYVISDDGIFPFRAGLLTPPALTVISGRRIETGQLTPETLIAASEQYRPQAIVLWENKFMRLPEYVDWVNRHYCLARAWSDSQRIYTACEILQQSDGLEVQFGELFGIAGWSLGVRSGNDGVVSPGDTVLVTTRWQTLRPTDADYHIFCHLGKETLIAQWDGRPRRGEYPTYRWLQGEEVIDSCILKIPANAPEGYYPLWVGMYDIVGRDRLPVKDAQGQHIGSALLLTHLRVGKPEFEKPIISQPHEAKLEDQVRFLGYDLPLENVRPGGLVNLTLYWQCLKEMNTSYTVFTHVLDADGSIVGQWDSIPQGSTLPTTTWMPGEFVADHYQIPVAEDAPPGPYHIEVGMYDVHTGRRLPVVRAGGERLPGDRIMIPQGIQVK